MPLEQSFSSRHGFSPAKAITIHEDAPENLRYFVVQIAADLGWRPDPLRRIICRVLRVIPINRGDRDIQFEVQELMNTCPWFKVYDIIEALHASFARNDYNIGGDEAGAFADEINKFF